MSDNRSKYDNKRIYTLLLAFIGLILLWPLMAAISFAKVERVSPSASLKVRLELKEEGPFYVGDSVPVDLIVEGTAGDEYLLPELEPKQLNGLELAARDKTKKTEGKTGWKHTISYRFTGWRAGEYEISGITVNYRNRSGNQGSVSVNDLRIKITSLLPGNLNEAEILADGLREPKRPAGLPPRYQYFGAFFAGIGLFGLLYWLFKRWRRGYRNKAIAAEEYSHASVEPPHLIALRRLEDLRREQFLEKGEFKLFYDKLSEIAREYLENRFQIRALEMTTEEFLISLGRMDFLSAAQQKNLAEFLQYSDLVKFAKHLPVKDEGDKALTIIHGLIEETKEEAENDI